MGKSISTVATTLLALVVVGGIGYGSYVYMSTSGVLTPASKRSVASYLPTAAPTTPTTPSPRPSLTPTPKPAQTITAGLNHTGGIAFPTYTILVPGSWTANHQSTSGASPTDTLTLTKGNIQMKIYQAAIPAEPCLYPGDADRLSGTSMRLTSYFEFNGPEGIIFRAGTKSQTASTQTLTVCMRRTSSNTLFGHPTSFGDITIIAPVKLQDTDRNEITAMAASLKAQ